MNREITHAHTHARARTHARTHAHRCVNGAVGTNDAGESYSWTLGARFHFPEKHCCECGGGKAGTPVPVKTSCAPVPFRDPVVQGVFKHTYHALVEADNSTTHLKVISILLILIRTHLCI